VEVRGIASGVSGKGWMGMAPKELAAVMRAVEGAVMMGDEAVVEMAVVEIPVMKVTVMVVKDEEGRAREEGESGEASHRPPPPR